jgi:hypothetical protein
MMQLLQIQPKENILQIDDWQDYFRDGEQFLSTAVGAHRKNKNTFSPEAIFNITAMAIEKFIMAFLMKNGDLAENHTMTDLAAALVRHTGPIPELTEKLHYLDTFQDICDLEVSSYIKPTQEQIAEIVAIGQEVERLFTPYLKSE